MNRGRWLELVIKICQTSPYLEHLEVKNTATTAAQGLPFLQQLADSEISTLKYIDFSGGKQYNLSKGNKQELMNNLWFEGQKQEPVEALKTILNRQIRIKELVMEHCELSEV